jgi:hypothetical protein
VLSLWCVLLSATTNNSLASVCCSYVANTIDINKDEAEYQWLLKVLSDQVGLTRQQPCSISVGPV